jgi:hypothetical protein
MITAAAVSCELAGLAGRIRAWLADNGYASRPAIFSHPSGMVPGAAVSAASLGGYPADGYEQHQMVQFAEVGGPPVLDQQQVDGQQSGFSTAVNDSAKNLGFIAGQPAPVAPRQVAAPAVISGPSFVRARNPYAWWPLMIRRLG